MLQEKIEEEKSIRYRLFSKVLLAFANVPYPYELDFCAAVADFEFMYPYMYPGPPATYQRRKWFNLSEEDLTVRDHPYFIFYLKPEGMLYYLPSYVKVILLETMEAFDSETSCEHVMNLFSLLAESSGKYGQLRDRLNREQKQALLEFAAYCLSGPLVKSSAAALCREAICRLKSSGKEGLLEEKSRQQVEKQGEEQGYGGNSKGSSKEGTGGPDSDEQGTRRIRYEIFSNILLAFADVPYPYKRDFHAAMALSEYEDPGPPARVARKRWFNVSEQDIISKDRPFFLCYLEPEGMLYYLPAYVKVILLETIESFDPEYMQQHVWVIFNALSDLSNKYRNLRNMLNRRQKEALLEFATYCLNSSLVDEFDKEEYGKAISRLENSCKEELLEEQEQRKEEGQGKRAKHEDESKKNSAGEELPDPQNDAYSDVLYAFSEVLYPYEYDCHAAVVLYDHYNSTGLPVKAKKRRWFNLSERKWFDLVGENITVCSHPYFIHDLAPEAMLYYIPAYIEHIIFDTIENQKFDDKQVESLFHLLAKSSNKCRKLRKMLSREQKEALLRFSNYCLNSPLRERYGEVIKVAISQMENAGKT